MSKRRLTAMERSMELQEGMNSALKEFNQRAAVDLPKFRDSFKRYGETVKRAIR